MSKIIIMEGLDCSGKTTIRNKILSATNKYIVWDRGPASQWVYGNLLRKEDSPSGSELLKIENDLVKHAIYVYCKAKKEDIIKRCIQKKEDPLLYTEEIIEKCEKLYETYFDFSILKIFSINTSVYDAENCAKQILYYVSLLDERW